MWGFSHLAYNRILLCESVWIFKHWWGKPVLCYLYQIHLNSAWSSFYVLCCIYLYIICCIDCFSFLLCSICLFFWSALFIRKIYFCTTGCVYVHNLCHILSPLFLDLDTFFVLTALSDNLSSYLLCDHQGAYLTSLSVSPLIFCWIISTRLEFITSTHFSSTFSPHVCFNLRSAVKQIECSL